MHIFYALITDFQIGNPGLVGDEGVIAPWIQGAFNEVTIWYGKLDDLLLDAALRSEFYHEVMTLCLRRLFALVDQYIAAGVDILSTGGNIASGEDGGT